MEKTYTLEQIYHMITTQAFDEWSQSDFIDHIEGEDGAKTTAQILKDLEKLLK